METSTRAREGGSREKEESTVQTVDRQSVPAPSTPAPTKASKPKSSRQKHKRGSAGTNPRHSNPNARHSTSSLADTSSEVEAELAAIPMPRVQEKYAMTRTLSPFWRTKKGYLVISACILLVVLAIVGAAVGGAISNREAKKEDEREAAASSAAIAATASVEARDQYAEVYLPRETPAPTQAFVWIRGRKPPARSPTT